MCGWIFAMWGVQSVVCGVQHAVLCVLTESGVRIAAANYLNPSPRTKEGERKKKKRRLKFERN